MSETSPEAENLPRAPDSAAKVEKKTLKTRLEKIPELVKKHPKAAAMFVASPIVATIVVIGAVSQIEDGNEPDDFPTPTPTMRDLDTPHPTLEPTQTIAPTPQVTETPSPTVQETPVEEVNIYTTISENIQNSQLSEFEKAQLEQSIIELRQIEETRDRFVTEYTQSTSESGEPVLLSLIKQKYSNINPSDIPGFDSTNPNAAYESQIFFLRDEKDWQNNVAPGLEALKSTSDGSQLQQEMQEIIHEAQNQYIYLETDSRSETNVQFQVNFTPQTEEDQQKLQETLNQLEDLKTKMPLFGNYQVTIKNQGDGASEYIVEGDSEVIEVSVEKQSDLAHELGHSLVIFDFPYLEENETRTVENHVRFLRYYSPEEVVQIMENELRILLDLTIGKHYPAKTEDPAIILAKEQLTSQDLGELATWAATVHYDKAYGFPLMQRTERADIEHLAEVLGRFYEERERIVSDDAIDILDYNRQLLGITI